MKYSSLILSAALILFLFAGGIFLLSSRSSEKKKTAKIPEKIIIVAFGTSLTEGVGSSRGGFVSLLENKTGYPIVNLGKSGETTGDALARLDSVFAYGPDIVILDFGGNDALRKMPINETFANLETIIDALHGRGAEVLLLGIRGGVISDPYASRFKALAKEKETAYVPDILDGIFGHPDFMSDAVHPNDKGYEMIADKIFPVLSKMLP